jgi:hypothetical protein
MLTLSTPHRLAKREMDPTTGDPRPPRSKIVERHCHRPIASTRYLAKGAVSLFQGALRNLHVLLLDDIHPDTCLQITWSSRLASVGYSSATCLIRSVASEVLSSRSPGSACSLINLITMRSGFTDWIPARMSR